MRGKGWIFVVGLGWGMGGRTSRPNLEALTGRKILFVRAIKYLRIRHSVLEVLLLVLAFAYEVLDEVFVVYHQIIYDLSFLSGMCPLPHTVTLCLSFTIYHCFQVCAHCPTPSPCAYHLRFIIYHFFPACASPPLVAIAKSLQLGSEAME